MDEGLKKRALADKAEQSRPPCKPWFNAKCKCLYFLPFSEPLTGAKTRQISWAAQFAKNRWFQVDKYFVVSAATADTIILMEESSGNARCSSTAEIRRSSKDYQIIQLLASCFQCLMTHSGIMHAGQRDFECSIWGKKFWRSGNLDTCKNSAWGPKGFWVFFCSNVFSPSASLYKLIGEQKGRVLIPRVTCVWRMAKHHTILAGKVQP